MQPLYLRYFHSLSAIEDLALRVHDAKRHTVGATTERIALPQKSSRSRGKL